MFGSGIGGSVLSWAAAEIKFLAAANGRRHLLPPRFVPAAAGVLRASHLRQALEEEPLAGRFLQRIADYRHLWRPAEGPAPSRLEYRLLDGLGPDRHGELPPGQEVPVLPR